MKLSDLLPICGIYKITNTENGRIYIGQSTNIPYRWAGHVSQLVTGKHGNTGLLEDFQKMGADVFTADVIEKCAKELLCERERHYISLYYQEGHSLYNATKDSNGQTYLFVKNGGKRWVWDYETHSTTLED